MLSKATSLKRRSIFDRSSTLITINENNVEKINLEDYKKEFKIDKTSLGYIYICKHIKTNKLFFMKVLKKVNLLQNKNTEHVTSEYSILSNIYHPFIIELRGINSTNPVTLNFLFEYIPGGNLSSLLRAQKRLSIEISKFYLASIITALDYLHKKNIIYRDLRPHNILITKNGYIKLSEFGFAKKLETEMTFTMCGSPEYYSPEMLRKSGYNKSTDFWSLGIILYEMIIGCTPFIDSDPLKIYQKINKNKVLFPRNIDIDTKNIIKKFLTSDTNKRLGCDKNGIGNIVDDNFFKGFNWKDLLFQNLDPPYVPKVNGSLDTSNFRKIEDNNKDDYDDVEIEKEKDPFYNW